MREAIHEPVLRPIGPAQTPTSGRAALNQSTVAVVGATGLGLALAAHFYRLGGQVWLVEPDAARRRLLSEARCADVDPGLGAEVERGITAGRIRLTDASGCAGLAPVLFVCVDTASTGGSATRLTGLEELAANLKGGETTDEVMVVLASKVPVGTADWLQHLLGPGFEVASLPVSPAQVQAGAHPGPQGGPPILGAGSDAARVAICDLFEWDPGRLVVVTRSEAELVQNARDSAIAVHYKLVHEVAAVAERMGADVVAVLQAAGLDRRHAPREGAGTTGDWNRLQQSARMLSAVAETAAVEAPALRAASEYSPQGRWDMGRLASRIGRLEGRRVAIWGLSHANEQPDLQSPAVSLAQTLSALGADVIAYDPDWEPLAPLAGVRLAESRQAALAECDLLLVLTERPEFDFEDWVPVARQTREQLVIDLRPRARTARPGALWNIADDVSVQGGIDAGGEDAHTVEGLPQVALVRAFLTRIPESSVAYAAPPRSRRGARRLLYPALKRALDVVVSGAMLLALAPLLALLALATLVDSGRPVFFASKRVGRHGRPFVMFKFRTMGTDAPVVGNKSDTGSYVTRLGRYLRTLNLDELPQLWNVLLGDMSLVGPRPEQPHIAQWYQPWQAERLNVPPGMTGWWQLRVRGSNNEMYQHVEYDVWYVRNAGFGLDLWLLLLTPLVLLGFRPGSWSAPVLGHRAGGASA